MSSPKNLRLYVSKEGLVTFTKPDKVHLIYMREWSNTYNKQYWYVAWADHGIRTPINEIDLPKELKLYLTLEES